MVGMKGKILSYRRGKHTQNVNQMLVEVEGVDSKEKAEKIVGKKLVWKTPGGREIEGEIIGVHGGKGVVRAKFERNLPGQSITNSVEVEE
jgi:large subunit ribosomal protein L35Ae